MRAYVGCIDRYGLRRFLLEDTVPRNVLRQLIMEWSSRTTIIVWAVVADDSAEAIRREVELIVSDHPSPSDFLSCPPIRSVLLADVRFRNAVSFRTGSDLDPLREAYQPPALP
jgi:hypothetical protein